MAKYNLSTLKNLILSRITNSATAGSITRQDVGQTLADMVDSLSADEIVGINFDADTRVLTLTQESGTVLTATIPGGSGGEQTAAQIRDALTTLTGNNRLPASAVRDLFSGNYNDLTNKPTIPTIPARAGAFTAADEAKLDGIQEGAQANPDHVVSFRTLDNDGAIDGTVYFIKADNTQWNTGSTDDIAAVEIDSTQFSLTQNPQTATPAYGNWHSLPQDLVDNKGSSIWNFYNMGSGVTLPDAPTFQLQAETVARNEQGNYVLQHIHVLKGWTWTGSGGVNWQVSGVFAPPSGADSIIGVIASANLPPYPVVPDRAGAFTAEDEQDLTATVEVNQYPLGTYTRRTLAGSHVVGDYYDDSGNLAVFAAANATIRRFWKNGAKIRIGNAVVTLSNVAQTSTWITASAAVVGTLPSVGTASAFIRESIYALKGEDALTPTEQANLARVSAIDHTAFVDRSELEGKETDRYASYTNGFMAQSGYRVGFISLFNQSTVPTDDTNAVRQPDITDDTTVVLAWGARLRLDKDPNHFQADTTDFVPSNGDTLYVSIWNDAAARMDVTLTSTPEKVGTGNAAFYWATASVDEVNNIPDVAVVGDYFKVADEAPSDLDLRIPAKDIVNLLPYLARQVADETSELTPATKVMLANFMAVTLAHLSEHTRPITTSPRRIALTWETTANTITQGSLKVGWQNSINADTNIGQLRVGFNDPQALIDGGNISVADIESILNLHHNLDITLSGVVIKGEITSFTKAFGVYYINLENATQVGTPSDGDAAVFILQSNIMDRDETEAAIAAAVDTIGKWGTPVVYTSGITGEAANPWTSLLTGYATGTRLRLRGHTKVSGQDRRAFNLVVDYEDIPSGNVGGASGDKLWSYATPANGARFQFRRNGSTLYVSTAATLESYRLVCERWE